MNALTMSNEAYIEFKTFLAYNKIENFNIRITLAGVGWGGPVFNIVLDEQKENDAVILINDINFFIDKQLVTDFEGFVILSTEENNGKGLTLKPLVQADGGCSTCSSCH